MLEKALESDLKCIPLQKVVFAKTCAGAPANSFKPRNAPGEHLREDGVLYVNDVCYGEKYPNSHLDIYYPDGDKTKKRPTMIYLHGGGMIFGDKISGDPLAEGTGSDIAFCAEVAKKGYNVVSANYALAPEYRFPVQLEQVDKMLQYLTDNQELYGLDMECVFLGGGSAGACLSEIYGAMLVNPEYAEKIGVPVSIRKEQIAGLLIDEAALSVRHYEENMDAMFGCWMGVDKPSKREDITTLLDPTKWIGDTYIPSFINSSNMEIWFRDSAEDLAAFLEKNGTDYEFFIRGQECDKLEHGYMKRFASNEYAKECFEHMLQFMERRTGMEQTHLYDYEIEHIQTLRKLAPECMVLLKSDGNFPLSSAGKIAVYGNGVRHTVKGGTGSGDVNVRHYVTIEEGLENAGFTITTKGWMDSYDACYEQARKKFTAEIKARIAAEGISAIMLGIGAVMPEPEYDFPLDGEGDTAIYVLSRISGEGSDRQAVKGDFMLSDTETRDILALSKKYEKFMLVINAGGVVDVSPVLDEVNNVLLISQTGMTVGDSFADVLLGKSYPSGRLTSTWAKYEEYCQEGDFAQKDDTRYREGIYVGYRYFDIIGKKPVFSFGFGISYTTFSIKDESPVIEGTRITLPVLVENTGAYCGKEVVQAYVSVPEGKLNQPYQVLAAYAKTKELKPGEQTRIELCFTMEQLASYDEEMGAYILEKGNYILRAGTDSRSTAGVAAILLSETVILKEVGHVGGKADFADMVLQRTEKSFSMAGIEKDRIYQIPADAFHKSYQKENAGISVKEQEIRDLAAKLSDEELAYLCVGGFTEDGGSSFIGNAGRKVAGAAGETTGRLEDKGIGSVIMADGPAGLRLNRQYGVDEKGVFGLDDGNLESVYEMLPEEMIEMLHLKDKKEERHGEVFDQYCSAIPIGTAIAQSFSDEVAQACGSLVGEEMERFHVDLWLAPALNIHRNPLCGRNFEYFSEDPLISGKMAAAITKGVQEHPGKGVTVKHFVGNNQETNRMRSNSIMNERTLRDIYLKGFEIAVKESHPLTVMTSYNLLNGEHTSSRRDLMVDVLREEWGFEGCVMTDWVTQGLSAVEGHKYPMANAPGAIAAGNDLMMPGGRIDLDDLLRAMKEEVKGYRVSREDLETCAAHVIRLVRYIEKEKGGKGI